MADAPGRTAILQAARQLFASHGFRGTTLRAVAAEAGCDVALIAHHFGNKQGLFTAALDVRGIIAETRQLLERAPLESAGEIIVGHVMDLLDGPAGPRLLAAARTLLGDAPGPVSGPDARQFGMEVVWQDFVRRLAEAGYSAPETRVELVMSQVLGMVTLRQVAETSTVRAATKEEVVGWYAPTVQRYLTGML